MNHQDKREEFIKNLSIFYNDEELDKVLELKELKNHPKYHYLDYLEGQKFTDENEKKSLAKAIILLEFTLDRKNCDILVDILKEANLSIHEKLAMYNVSPGISDVSLFEEKLIVKKTNDPRSGYSLYYEMEKKKRGKCIIINNLVKDKIIDPIRFQDLFQQLHFECEKNDLWNNLTAYEIKERLKELSKDRNKLSKDDNAFILMIISHGTNERICGHDLKETVKVSTIIDIFSEGNCNLLKDKPKIFFFNCCRDDGYADLPEIEKKNNKSDTTRDESDSIKKFKWDQEEIKPEPLTSIDKNWIIENRNTFVIYACAQGHSMYYSGTTCTDFGQQFSRVLAQHACDRSLQSTINITNRNMISSHPELRALYITRNLYFNPGYTV